MKKLFELEQVKTFWNVIKKKFFRNPRNNASATKGQVLTYIDDVTSAWTDFPSVLTFKGVVDTYDDLAKIADPSVGDVYCVKGTEETSNIEYFWDGTAWEYMGTMFSGEGFVKKTGDTMTGNLLVSGANSTATLSAQSLEASNTYSTAKIGLDGLSLTEGSHSLLVLNEKPYSISFGEEVTASGLHSVAIGQKVTSAGELCFVAGNESSIDADASVCHVEGDLNTITGGSWASHVEGGENGNDSAHYAHVEGYKNTNTGNQAHVEGRENVASGKWAHTEGILNNNSGEGAHAEGQNNVVTGQAAHVEGYQGTVSGGAAHGEGFQPEAAGDYSHAEGGYAQAYGKYSHAEGCGSLADNIQSHAEGYHTKATGVSSHAEGQYTTAEGEYTHAEGESTHASGTGAHTEGRSTQATADYSHAEGSTTIASGGMSHAEGADTKAKAYCSHAQGNNTETGNNLTGQCVMGVYNEANETSMLIVGGGDAETRKNLFTVNTSGTATVAADPVNAMDVVTQQYLDTQLSNLIKVDSIQTLIDERSGKTNYYLCEDLNGIESTAVNIYDYQQGMTSFSGESMLSFTVGYTPKIYYPLFWFQSQAIKLSLEVTLSKDTTKITYPVYIHADTPLITTMFVIHNLPSGIDFELTIDDQSTSGNSMLLYLSATTALQGWTITVTPKAYKMISGGIDNLWVVTQLAETYADCLRQRLTDFLVDTTTSIPNAISTVGKAYTWNILESSSSAVSTVTNSDQIYQLKPMIFLNVNKTYSVGSYLNSIQCIYNILINLKNSLLVS